MFALSRWTTDHLSTFEIKLKIISATKATMYHNTLHIINTHTIIYDFDI